MSYVRNPQYELKYANGHFDTFDTFEEALAVAKQNSIISLTFTRDTTIYRWRPKTKRDTWSEETEQKLCRMLPAYKDERDPNVVYWVHQASIAPHNGAIFARYQKELANRGVITRNLQNKLDAELDQELALDCILDIVTANQFAIMFKTDANVGVAGGMR